MNTQEESTDYTYILIGVSAFLALLIAAIVAHLIYYSNKSNFGTFGSSFPVFDFNNASGDLPLLEF